MMVSDGEPVVPEGVRRFRLVAWRDRLLARLKARGVCSIRIRFTGGGDGGMFGAPEATDRRGKKVNLNRGRIDWPVEVSTLGAGGNWEKTTEIRKISAAQAIERLADDITDAVIMDWGFDCGACGTLTMDLAWERARIRLDVEDSGYLNEGRVYARVGAKLRLGGHGFHTEQIQPSGLYADIWDLPAELPQAAARRSRARGAAT